MDEAVILVVDDEPRTVKGIYKILKSEGGDKLDVLTAENGIKGLELLKTRDIDLLLLDIKMPELSGLSLLKKLREEGLEVTTILLTGHADFEYARSAIRLNVLNYLLKPVNKDDLIKEIKKALTYNKKRIKLKKGIKIMETCPHLFNDEEIKSDNPEINKAIKYIHDNLSKNITLKMVADHIYISESYFSVLFKAETGITFTDYLTKARLKKAKQLLLENNLRIYEIADNIGYHSAKYFIKVFRDHEGMTPNQFRKEMKQ
ncbi:MAG: response regulator transcription factor [Halanaerobiaceae bacterium]